MIRRNSRQSFKKTIEKSTVPRKFEVLQWLMFIVTILGIFAWISGAAYLMGYWGFIGLEGPIIASTLQQTALIGFIGAITTWLYAPTVVLGIGLILLLMGIRFKRQPKVKELDVNSWRSHIRAWVIGRFGYDREMGLFGICAVALSYLFIFLVVVPLIGWSIAAHHEGNESFLKETCKIRTETAIKAVVFTMNGKVMSGKIIDRSDRVVVLSDGFKVHVLTIDKVPTLSYSIEIPTVDCKALS